LEPLGRHRAVLLFQHLRPGFAELAHQLLDLGDGLQLLALVGLEKPAHVVVVKPVHGLGELPALLQVQSALELGQDALRLLQLVIDDLDPARVGLVDERGMRDGHGLQGAIIEHEDQLAGTGRPNGVGTVRPGVALGEHAAFQDWSSLKSGAPAICCAMLLITEGGG
jgi:hypothetical protein